jgi:hypothetical protein
VSITVYFADDEAAPCEFEQTQHRFGLSDNAQPKEQTVAHNGQANKPKNGTQTQEHEKNGSLAARIATQTARSASTAASRAASR